MANIDSIYRYPVKGLTPQRLPRATLAPGATIVGDRKYAIENGPTGFDPAAPIHQPKTKYLMLQRQESLARLDTHYDDATHAFTVRLDGEDVARGDLSTPEGRAAIEAFFARYNATDLNGPPKILHADNYSFSDVPRKVVSIINLASVAQIEALLGQPVNKLRFRANIFVTGWPAWHEFDLLERELALGDARVKVVKRIVRCAATNVDPETGARDLNVPQTLMQNFGHADCGVYAEVIGGGEVREGDEVKE